ncbi:hypothetical protein TNCV_3855231 [Trichonephila clavipes]|nr:hypothetical protein TNCV_3855231 [Trichonephila clavipes]
MYSTFAHEGTLNSRRAARSFARLVEGEERWEVPDHPRVFSLKIGVKPSQIVLSPAWCCSKLRLKTGVKMLHLAARNFVGLDLMLLSISQNYLASLRQDMIPIWAPELQSHAVEITDLLERMERTGEEIGKGRKKNYPKEIRES